MDSNTALLEAIQKFFPIALITELIIVLLYVIINRKCRKNRAYWQRCGILVFGINTIIFFITFWYIQFRPKEIVERKVTLEPETITQVNYIEKENVIDVPSIVLPLEPEGNQAIIIDAMSLEMEEFMKGFYGENVYFFNNRQDATYLAKTEGVANYSGLDIAEIEYSNTNGITTIQLDDMNYQTVWVFSDLTHLDIVSSNTKVMLYVPKQLTDKELQKLKQTNSDITIIAIDQIS